MCCRIKYAENLLKKFCLQVVFQTIWTFSYNCYSLDLLGLRATKIWHGDMWRACFKRSVTPQIPRGGTPSSPKFRDFLHAHSRYKKINQFCMVIKLHLPRPPPAWPQFLWSECWRVFFFSYSFLANLHVYLNLGASDSALMLTMCALEMLVLLLLINTFW